MMDGRGLLNIHVIREREEPGREAENAREGKRAVCVREAGNGKIRRLTHILSPPLPLPDSMTLTAPRSFRAYRSRGGDDGGEGGRCLEGMGSDDE
jgi:hypothetical protein